MDKTYKNGDFIQLVYNCKITKKINSESADVIDIDRGTKFTITGLLQSTRNADQFSKTSSVSRTELIEILITSNGSILSCKFVKQNGEDRVLRGYFVSLDKGFGRSNCIDLEVNKDEHRLRQVDHRTLEWVILDDVRYMVK